MGRADAQKGMRGADTLLRGMVERTLARAGGLRSEWKVCREGDGENRGFMYTAKNSEGVKVGDRRWSLLRARAERLRAARSRFAARARQMAVHGTRSARKQQSCENFRRENKWTVDVAVHRPINLFPC